MNDSMCVDEIGDRIVVEGARHFSEMLRENSTLLFLDIRGEFDFLSFFLSIF